MCVHMDLEKRVDSTEKLHSPVSDPEVARVAEARGRAMVRAVARARGGSCRLWRRLWRRRRRARAVGAVAAVRHLYIYIYIYIAERARRRWASKAVAPSGCFDGGALIGEHRAVMTSRDQREEQWMERTHAQSVQTPGNYGRGERERWGEKERDRERRREKKREGSPREPSRCSHNPSSSYTKCQSTHRGSAPRSAAGSARSAVPTARASAWSVAALARASARPPQRRRRTRSTSRST